MFNPSVEFFVCKRHESGSILHIFIAFQHFNERLAGKLWNCTQPFGCSCDPSFGSIILNPFVHRFSSLNINAFLSVV
ncbi:hypothetical protein AXF42_Ash013141 [Apostasia shenzhenica]|uniref:Uncharacterized protein n=1 Tax=Apostasia shenzhenica TaxID=1088818 RepID=A0A2I0BD89_9ASPA|nr:hypothetical protein AXF42_Ash013141 [Apostasia shenzhenica]